MEVGVSPHSSIQTAFRINDAPRFPHWSLIRGGTSHTGAGRRRMAFNDYEAAWLASAVYYGGDKETFDREVPKGWKKVECSENAESGFVCMLFTKVTAVCRTCRGNHAFLRACRVALEHGNNHAACHG